MLTQKIQLHAVDSVRKLLEEVWSQRDAGMEVWWMDVLDRTGSPLRKLAHGTTLAFMAHLYKESPRFYALMLRIADCTMCVGHRRIDGTLLQLPSPGFARLLLMISEHPSEYLTTGTLWDDLDELNAALEPFVFRLVLFHVKVDRLHRFFI